MSDTEEDCFARLKAGKHWRAWERDISIMVHVAELSEHVFDKEPLLDKPVPPNMGLQIYLKKATVPCHPVGLTPGQAPGSRTAYVRDDGVPWSTADLTETGLMYYQGDLATGYNRMLREWNYQQDSVQRIKNRIKKTVGTTYRSTCLREGQQLYEWIENLRLACRMDEADEKEDARDEYHEALSAPLTYYTAEKWVATWEDKFTTAQDMKVAEVQDVSAWANDFLKKTRPFLPDWSLAYRAFKQADIRKGNLHFLQLGNDFRQAVQTEPKPPRNLATRGAFPATHDDSQKRGDRSHRHGYASKYKHQFPSSGKRVRNPRAKRGRDKNDTSTPECECCHLSGHKLEHCFYAFPEESFSFKSWKPRRNVLERANKEMKDAKLQAKISDIRQEKLANPTKKRRVG